MHKVNVSRFALLFVLVLAGLPWVGTQAGAATTKAGVTQRTVVLSVENMTCPICPITIRKALERVPGVRSASADLATGTAKVTFDPNKTKVAALIKATTDAGYPSHLRK